MSNDLTTAEAAVRMGISVEKVRDLCRDGQLGGADKDDRGHWCIPESDVDDWVAQNGQTTPPPPPDSSSNPDPNEDSEHLVDKWQKAHWYGLMVIIGVIATALTIGPAIRDNWDLIQPWLPTEAPFASESENEVLIVIANFHYTEGIAHTEAHNEIRQAIEEKANEFDFTNLRVEVEPTSLRAEAREEAEALGQQYDASMVIWGADSGVRVTVNFLNLKEPYIHAADVKITETERAQLAKPDAYTEFITQDLPSQLTFLSLFAVGQSYAIENNYQQAIEIIEIAVNSHPKDENSQEGLAEAYFRLGWLYQVPSENHEQAIANYDQALELNPDYETAYNNRGIARSDLGDLQGAIADYDQAIRLNPNYAFAYYFERFYRVDRSRARRSGGSGIGLTIARQLAWAMGGDLSAESDGLEQGSSFRFTLPLADGH